MSEDVLRLRILGDPVLAIKAEKITRITNEMRHLADKMIEIMRASNGIGLAGPQVGVSKRIIVLELSLPGPDKEGNLPQISPGEALLIPQMPLTLVNPVITSANTILLEAEEGCLSVPEFYASLFRPTVVNLRAQTLQGETLGIECGGWLARALQHEIDHLDGILFVDRLSKDTLRKNKAKLEKIREQGTQKGFLKRLFSNGHTKEELF